MAVIKQVILQKITNEVTEAKFQKKLAAANAKIRNLVQALIIKDQDKLEFPKALIDAKYIHITTSVYLTLPRRRYSTNITVNPYPTKNGDVFRVDHNQTPQLEKACQSFRKLEDEEDEYRCKFRQTLFALKTDKRIIDNLPELASYLIKHRITPPLATNAIIPVSLINDMRNDIKTMTKNIK